MTEYNKHSPKFRCMLNASWGLIVRNNSQSQDNRKRQWYLQQGRGFPYSKNTRYDNNKIQGKMNTTTLTSLLLTRKSYGIIDPMSRLWTPTKLLKLTYLLSEIELNVYVNY